MTAIATIDLGTNTVRMLVAERGDNGFDTLFSDQIITRLGEGLHETGKLGAEAMKRTVGAIAKMVSDANMHQPFDLHIFATSAARDAKNSDTLAAMIEVACGASLTVIDWEEEARLSLIGTQMVVGQSVERFILFDIGGGSTEYILADKEKVAGKSGTDLGVVRLAESYISEHPVNNREYVAMLDEIEEKVDEAFITMDVKGGEAIVGTAGTVTSLAAMAMNMAKYDPAKVNNYHLTSESVEALRRKLFAMTIEERSHIIQISNGREDLIVPGIAIVLATLKRACATEMVVSDYAAREGKMMELLERQNG